MSKKILFEDMDNVIVDFKSGINKLPATSDIYIPWFTLWCKQLGFLKSRALGEGNYLV